MAKIAVLGYGTVGSGIVEVISRNGDLIAGRIGETLEVKYILDIRDFPGDPFADRVVHDIDVILQDPEISVVCETMGGQQPAFEFSKRALCAKKSVCTSNKELVASHGAELIELAKENGCNYLFEASVGGGIPIIRPLNTSLTAERVVEITGILNGTTNYILTKMKSEKAPFSDLLRRAQEKGYAERNPEADIEGYDACRKIAILGSLMTGKTVDYRDIYTEGISDIAPEDFAYAQAIGTTIKLLATVKEDADGYLAAVAPLMLSDENPLAGINNVFNAIVVHGNMQGETMYYGKGAGKLATASAVVADVIDCVKHPGKHVICLWSKERIALKDFSKVRSKFFVRTAISDLETAGEVFGRIEPVRLAQLPEEFGFVTQEMSEAEFAQKQQKLPGFLKRIRIKD